MGTSVFIIIKTEWGIESEMKQTWKKAMAVLLTLSMALSLCVTGAWAEEPGNVDSGPVYYDGGTKKLGTSTVQFFFANGTPITIQDNPGGEGALITWDNGQVVVSKLTNVFGGAHDNDTPMTTSVTMEGGTVNAVFGGGMHKSHVTEANVLLKSGVVTSQVAGGGAASFKHDCGCGYGSHWYSGDAKSSPCKVDTANVTIEDGVTVTGLLYGGGEGISCTGAADMTIGGGTFTSCYVVAGGSNGYTGAGRLTINGGDFKVVQGVNRGSMDSIAMFINGGRIANLYIGGETSDQGVTGVYETASAQIAGAEIKSLLPGSNTTATTDRKNDAEKITSVTLSEKTTIGNLDGALEAFGGKLSMPMAVQIGEIQYPTLAKAIAAVTENAQEATTITLLRDTAEDVDVVNRNIVLDLGGHTLSNVKNHTLRIKNSTVLVQNGTVQGLNDATGIGAGRATKLTVAATATVTGGWAVGVNNFLEENNDKTTAGENTVVEIYGTVKGQTNTNYGAGGITINGNLQSKEKYAKIHIHSGATVTGYHGKSGNTNYDDGPAIYAAGYGEWTIDAGATLSGDEALSIKAGKFSIGGGAFTASGKFVDPATAWGNGTEATGAAVSITTNNGYAKDVEMTVSGGTFTSQNGYAFYESDTREQSGSALKPEGEFAISDGTFTGARGAVYSKHAGAFITGGTFSNDPSGYVAQGYAAVQDGSVYKVQKKAENAAEVVTAAPDVNTESTTIAGVEPEKVGETKTAIENAVKETAADLTGVAQTVANSETITRIDPANHKVTVNGQEKTIAEAVAEVKAESDNSDLVIVVQPYLAIEAKSYDAENGTMTLDIKPVYKTVATTKTVVESGEIVTKAEAGETVNAVEIGTPQLMPVSTNVTVSVPLPTGLVDSTTAALYVKHTKDNGRVYYYQADLTESGESITATFTTTHGFSEFTLQTDARKAENVTFKKEDGTTLATKTLTLADVNNSESLPTLSKSGCNFDGWKFQYGSPAAEASGVYATLTEELLNTLNGKTDIVATPVFSIQSSGSGGGSGSSGYSVNVGAAFNGAVTVSPKTAAKGAVVTVTVKPNTGYILDTLTVTDKDGEELTLTDKGGGKYTFTMPASKVDVKAAFISADTWTNPFTDVADDAWCIAGVRYVHSNGLMNGTTAATFSPDVTMTREMLAATLYRMEGQPAADLTKLDGFTDTASVHDYARAAMAWAVEKGILQGNGGRLLPQNNITREQLAAMLFRYAAPAAVTTEENLTSFSDHEKVSSFAVSALNWAVGQGIVTGKTDGTLDPQGSATRAQVAMMLQRFSSLEK